MMKKASYFILSICILLVFGVVAMARVITITNNSVPVNLQPRPVIVNGRTFAVSGAFYSMKCDVTKIPYYNVIVLHKGQKKIFVQADNKEYFVFEGNIKQFKEKVNEGIKATEKSYFETPPFIDNGLMYLPIRELSEELGYSVDWDDDSSNVVITSSEKLQSVGNADKEFVQDIKKYFTTLEKIDKGELSGKKYEEGNFDILYEFAICERSDEQYITNREALAAFAKLIRADEDDADIKDWYAIEEFEILDDKISEEDKVLLLSILDRRNILTRKDILTLELDSNLKEGDAVMFAVRAVGDTYGCTDYPEEMDYKNYNEAYARAYEKGIYNSEHAQNGENVISRNAFYEILNRLLFAEYTSGGYSGALPVRHIDYLERAAKYDTTEVETVVTAHEITPRITWNDDLSVMWTVPDDLKKQDFDMQVRAYSENGNWVSAIGYGGFYDRLESNQVVEMIVKAYPEKLTVFEIEYYQYDFTNHTKEEYIIKIDASAVNVICDGVAPKAGEYRRNKGQWPCNSLSLNKGDMFEEGAYYVLTGKEHTYRKEEYNSTDYDCFRASETTGKITSFGRNASFGINKFDEVRIIKATVAENLALHISPPSEDVFEVIEE